MKIRPLFLPSNGRSLPQKPGGKNPKPPGKTMKQAAPLLGISLRTLKNWKKLRIIGYIEMSPRKIFITDEEIERYKQKRTRHAIV